MKRTPQKTPAPSASNRDVEDAYRFRITGSLTHSSSRHWHDTGPTEGVGRTVRISICITACAIAGHSADLMSTPSWLLLLAAALSLRRV